MEACLLCLDVNQDLVDCIKVDSTQWEERNIKNLIEKHLWAMDSILPSSWLCYRCWQALKDFHNFYMLIEEAHMEFCKPMKIEIEPGLKDTKEELTNEDKIALNESYIDPNILLDQSMIEDNKTIIFKQEDDNLEQDKILIKQIKRKCRPINMTNIKETKSGDPLKRHPPKSKTLAKSKGRKKQNPVIETIIENSKTEGIQLMEDLETLQSDSDNFDSYTDLDHKTKRSKKTSSDSDDYNTDLDYKPEEDDTKPNKLTSKERDTFLAENFKMSCILCQIPMTNFHTLTKHFEMEHKERGYAVCCNKKFKKRTTLLEHVRRHVEPDNLKCNECGKVMSSQKSLENHQLVHLPEEEKKFDCTECGNSYVEQKKLAIHINRVHLRNYEKICDICGKRLRCGEVFQRHMLEHEGKSLPGISCKTCGLVVTSKHNLRRHINMKHPVDGKKEHMCSICFKVSPNIYALRKHINCTHRKDNSHKCTVCGRGFKRPIALREHMATHTGIALYTCPWCPKTFNASGGMHAHRKTQHPVEWEESRRQKNLEKCKTLAVTEDCNLDGTDFKIDINNINANSVNR